MQNINETPEQLRVREAAEDADRGTRRQQNVNETVEQRAAREAAEARVRDPKHHVEDHRRDARADEARAVGDAKQDTVRRDVRIAEAAQAIATKQVKDAPTKPIVESAHARKNRLEEDRRYEETRVNHAAGKATRG